MNQSTLMQGDSIKTVTHLIRLLASSYPSYRPNPDIFYIYAGKLKQYPIQFVEQACNEIVETNKYFPTIAELITVIRKIQSTWNDKERSRREALPPLPKSVIMFDDLSIEMMRSKGYESVDYITEDEVRGIMEKCLL